MASWPMRSLKVAGRYLRARTRYGLPCAASPRSDTSPAVRFGLSASFIVPPASARSVAIAILLQLPCREFRWEADERPEPRSLGLLPSGSDPVGEWLVHRQPPASISAERNENASGERGVAICTMPGISEPNCVSGVLSCLGLSMGNSGVSSGWELHPQLARDTIA